MTPWKPGVHRRWHWNANVYQTHIRGHTWVHGDFETEANCTVQKHLEAEQRADVVMRAQRACRPVNEKKNWGYASNVAIWSSETGLWYMGTTSLRGFGYLTPTAAAISDWIWWVPLTPSITRNLKLWISRPELVGWRRSKYGYWSSRPQAPENEL